MSENEVLFPNLAGLIKKYYQSIEKNIFNGRHYGEGDNVACISEYYMSMIFNACSFVTCV